VIDGALREWLVAEFGPNHRIPDEEVAAALEFVDGYKQRGGIGGRYKLTVQRLRAQRCPERRFQPLAPGREA
jgi:hypothetical protein